MTVGLFRPYERKEADKAPRSRTLTPKEPVRKTTETPADTGTGATATSQSKQQGRHGAKKNAPTPTRKAAVAARMERLHPTLSKKEARSRARAVSRAESEERWRKFEQSPERKLVRDFVDSRWTLSEFVLPALLLFMAASMFLITVFPAAGLWVTIGMWVYFVATIIQLIVMWRRLKVELKERIQGASTRGLPSYLVSRAIMIRRFRHPGAQISRGEAY